MGSENARSSILNRLVAELPRADQRRWAALYIDQLARLDGELGARTLVSWMAQSEELSGDSLQRFLNRSPWDADAIRRATAALAEEKLGAEAWVVKDVVFAKHGTQSPGVDRQYVYESKRLINCQQAVTVCLATMHGALPVNWHLRIPPSWHQDQHRRARARIPADEMPANRDTLILRLLDETSAWELLSSLPIVCRGEHPASSTKLAGRLAAHAYRFVLGVDSQAMVLPDPAESLLHDPRARHQLRPLLETVVEYAPERSTVTWPLRHGAIARGQFGLVPVRIPQPSGRPPLRLRALVEWPLGKAEPVAYWLTNLDNASIQRLVNLTRLARVSDRAIDELQSRFALSAFEGRTFPGWHHHVALASAAYALWLSCKTDQSARGALARPLPAPAVDPGVSAGVNSGVSAGVSAGVNAHSQANIRAGGRGISPMTNRASNHWRDVADRASGMTSGRELA